MFASGSLITAVLLATPPGGVEFDADAARTAIRANVAVIASPGAPGPLLVTGNAAVVIDAPAGDGSRVPVVAAGVLGAGRFVAFGHTAWMGVTSARQDDTLVLIRNAIRWVGRDDAPRIVTTAGGTARLLAGRGFDARFLTGPQWTVALAEGDVVITGQRQLDGAAIAAVRAHVERGGGAIICGLGWGWLEQHPDRTLPEHPGTRLLGDVGVRWADGTIKEPDNDRLALDAPPHPLTHAGAALDALAEGISGDGAVQAAATAIRALHTLPADDTLLGPRLDALIAAHGDDAVPRDRDPLRRDDARGRFVLAAVIEQAKRAAPEDVTAHPAAEHFPGAVPADAPRERAVVPIDPDNHDWNSTGRYAPPGEVVTLTLPARLRRAGLRLRIGAHKDRLYDKDAWQRAPEIARSVAVMGPTTRLATPFGGLVYIEVPRNRAMAPISAVLDGTVAAPRFVLGETDIDAWRETIRHAPGPWAELEADRVVVTVPAATIRDLEDPRPVLEFWDDVADAAADLAALPHRRRHKERYVADIQISAGYMHAGYPIMTHLDAAPKMVDVAAMRRGQWGLFHELGHNHQNRDWTFGGTGEVTCNLFSLYIIDTLCDPPDGDRGHPNATKDVGLDAYLAAGAPFDEWKRKPFLALRMYVQMQREFGWDAFKTVFAEYRDLPASQRPQDDAAKRDQWLMRFSRTVGCDLGPFFERWGVPVSAEARAAVADLPVWLPAGWE